MTEMGREKETEEGISFTFEYSKGGYVKKKIEKKADTKIPKWAYFIFAIIIISSIIILLKGSEMTYVNYLAYEKAYDSRYDEILDEVSKTYILSDESTIDMAVKEKLKNSEDETMMKAKIFSESLKNRFKDDEGLPYFFSPDDYYYLRQARYLSEKSEGINVNNDFYSDLPQPKSLLPYVEFGMYKIMHFFDEDTRIEDAAFYYPAILGVLSVIVFFFISRYFAGIKGALLSTAIFAFHPVFYINSRAGFADTNSLNLFLSLIIFYLLVKVSEIKLAFEKPFFKKNRNELKRALLFGTLAIFAVLVFRFAWNGYLYMVILFIIYLLASAMVHYARSGKIGAYATLSAIMLSAGAIYLIKDSYFIKALSSYLFKTDEGIYATAFSTITELQGVDFYTIISMFGGKFALVLSLAAIAYFTYVSVMKKDEKAIMLLSFLIPLFIVTMLSRRFMSYFIPFLAIALGSAASRGIAYLAPRMVEFFDFDNKKAVDLFLYSFFIVILISSFAGIYDLLKHPDYSLPVMDDSIKEASQAISRNSSDAIIVTWWDFGYMYEYYSRREVLFDGGNFEQKKLYWFSEAMLSVDINRSANIFRMLGCHAERHIDQLISERGYESFKIINSLLESRESASEAVNKYNLSQDIVEKIYCDKDIYIVLSSDLRQKYWAFVNFAEPNLETRFLKEKIKGLSFEESVEKLKKYLGDNATEGYFDIIQEAQNKEYFSDQSSCFESDEGLICKNGLVFDLNLSAAYDSNQEYSHIYYGANFSRKKIDGPDAVFYYDSIPYSLFVDPQYSESAFSKLYFGRKGNDRLDLFFQVPESISKGVVVYKLRS